MFTTPCFIRKNTKELRDKLSSITGTERWLFSLRNGYGNYIIHNQYIDSSDNSVEDNKCDLIDCGDNEELFLAIAALRDDSNEHQWFVWDFEEGDEGKGDRWKLYDNDSNWCWWIFEVHKATVEELIDHFKK